MDWADEIARELEREFRECWANGEKVSYPRRIAVALRKARSDALEEAATIEDSLYDEAPSGSYDNGGTQDGWQMACREYNNRICALKNNN